MADRLIGSEIDLLVFDRFPEPLDEDVVAPGTLAVHADLDLLANRIFVKSMLVNWAPIRMHKDAARRFPAPYGHEQRI